MYQFKMLKHKHNLDPRASSLSTFLSELNVERSPGNTIGAEIEAVVVSVYIMYGN